MALGVSSFYKWTLVGTDHNQVFQFWLQTSQRMGLEHLSGLFYKHDANVDVLKNVFEPTKKIAQFSRPRCRRLWFEILSCATCCSANNSSRLQNIPPVIAAQVVQLSSQLVVL